MESAIEPKAAKVPKVAKKPARPRKAVPAYEEKYTQALTALGYRVVMFKDVKDKEGHLPDGSWLDSRLVIREFVPVTVEPTIEHAWRVDFFHPATFSYVEIDGWGNAWGRRQISGHTNWAGFHRDRLKDRELVIRGWRGIHFGPGDLKNEAAVREAACFFQRLQDRIAADEW